MEQNLDIHIVSSSKGGAIHELPFIADRDDGFRRFKEKLSAAVVDAQDSFKSAGILVGDAVEKMETAISTVDKILAQNPDSDTPNSTASLMKAIGGLTPTVDVSVLEQRVAEIFDLNVINGLMLPQGSTDLGPLRRLFQALELDTSNCDLPIFGTSFVMVLAWAETVETAVGSTCGEDIVEFQVVERYIGQNIPISKASELSNQPEDDILVRFFWFDEAKSDRATLKRLKALGLSGVDLALILQAPRESGRVYSSILDTSILAHLREDMTDEEICGLMQRPDTNSGVNTQATSSDVTKQIRNTISSSSGGVSNRNKAGTTEEALTPPSSTSSGGSTVQTASSNVAPAGRAADPSLLLYSAVDLGRTLGATQDSIRDLIDQFNNGDDTSDQCKDILEFLEISLGALESVADIGRKFMLEVFGRLGNGVHNLQAGIQFSGCLVAINLGLDLNLSLALQLPTDMAVFLTAFGVALAAAVAAIAAAKAAICIPQIAISMLFGGVCGFKPFQFNVCPPDILETVDRVRSLIALSSGMLSSILSSLQIMKYDAQSAERASAQLKSISPCVGAASPLAIGLGLAGSLSSLPDLEVSASVLTPLGEVTV